MKSYETATVQIPAEDIFWLEQLKERARVESEDSLIGRDMDNGGGNVRYRLTDKARASSHYLEVLERILKQIQ
jgi:hypothetical protein